MRPIAKPAAVLLAGLLLTPLLPLASLGGDDDRPSPRGPLTLPKRYTETIPGTKVTFEMVLVPGGTFVQGSAASERGRRDDEGPAHRVTIRPFWMGRCEVTWDEFDTFRQLVPPRKKHDPRPEPLRLADAITRPSPPYIDETFGYGKEGYPVLGMTHHAAMEYGTWLSLLTGRTYRLPTEAEWEYACRAGSSRAYSFGDDESALADYAWYAKNADQRTHPVGKKRPNAWGLHDMHGNVAEWCLDHYDGDFYATLPRDRAALGPVKGPTAARFPHVVRGGSWESSAAPCRSAARAASAPVWQKSDPGRPQSIWWLSDADFVGFRVARPVEEQEDLKGLRSQVTRDQP